VKDTEDTGEMINVSLSRLRRRLELTLITKWEIPRTYEM